MLSAICTLFEGEYHYGVGALANSLYAHGFRGAIYAGYRGPLPPWVGREDKSEIGKVESRNRKAENSTSDLRPPTSESITDFSPAEGLTLRFIPLKTDIHLTNYKPDFMLELWEKHCPEAESMFYFDPDIVLNCQWSFFEDWIEAGVALCQNTGAWCPRNHPFRHRWRKYFASKGLRENRELDEYYNAGFVGCGKDAIEFLREWSAILHGLGEEKLVDLYILTASRTSFAYNACDQDALNMTAMVSKNSISSIGEEAMGFAYGGSGNLMLHALGSPKPWVKCYIKSSLRGRGPTWADKTYWNYTKTPISLYSPIKFLIKRADLVCGKILGRYI